VSVSAGSQHACARRATGRLSCWGEDQSGQLGDDPPFANHAGPRPVVGGATDWTMVTAGGGTTCARIRSGRLYCWGNGSLGAIGNANDDNQPLPVQVWA
jgi:alpha-tubulin suppressor-like RCC1 family protein